MSRSLLSLSTLCGRMGIIIVVVLWIPTIDGARWFSTNNHHPNNKETKGPTRMLDKLFSTTTSGGVVSPSSSSSSSSSTNKVLLQAEEVLQDFLTSSSDPSKRFHVHGWRWHTMSVIRESKRLRQLALGFDPSQDLAPLEKAVEYVVDFNLGALRRVETMFFVWIRQNTKKYDPKDEKTKVVVKALNTLLDHLNQESNQITKLGSSLTIDPQQRLDKPSRLRQVAETSRAISDRTESMLEKELMYVIPTVAQLIPQAVQDKFNHKVISTLGVFDARLHLVHMHEVVVETKSSLEEKLWKEAIPSLPRSLVPRWKRTLYEPKAGVLKDV